jgi:alkylated DNA repair dioxygenase AlkB
MDEVVPAIDEPAIDESVAFERLQLDEHTWIDIARGWLTGSAAVYDELVANVAFRQGRVWRYERWIDEPRLGAGGSVAKPGHPVLADAQRAIATKYNVRFDGWGFAYYRDSRDSVAMHRDREMRWLDDTVVAILTLGAQRPWQLRPRANRHADMPMKGATHDLAPASGDLLVMGGRCQADWEHSVPYRPGQALGTRISMQWRYTSKQGRPFQGSSYRAPLTYGRGR